MDLTYLPPASPNSIFCQVSLPTRRSFLRGCLFPSYTPALWHVSFPDQDPSHFRRKNDLLWTPAIFEGRNRTLFLEQHACQVVLPLVFPPNCSCNVGNASFCHFDSIQLKQRSISFRKQAGTPLLLPRLPLPPNQYWSLFQEERSRRNDTIVMQATDGSFLESVS